MANKLLIAIKHEIECFFEYNDYEKLTEKDIEVIAEKVIDDDWFSMQLYDVIEDMVEEHMKKIKRRGFQN